LSEALVDVEHFEAHGWVRVRGAFSADEAAAMRAATWQALESVGFRRNDPSTWHKERPDHLQHLKRNSVFQAVGSRRTLGAIDQMLAGQQWRTPKDWGAFFLVFPRNGTWDVPSRGWHIDAAYNGPLSPPAGLKVHAMYGDVTPRSGGMFILSGSHRLLHQWFKEHPPTPGAPSAHLRKSLHQHPYLQELCASGDPSTRAARFHEHAETVDGIPLQTMENTAEAGDVILMHPLLLHAPPVAHLGSQPRFVLNKDIYL
jgi:ectoine hydroxylase-related dioxygenase (phytanoyl-CoA dioxygenase family)